MNSTLKKYLPWLIIAATFGIALFLGFLQFFHNKAYLFYGDDTFGHFYTISLLQKGGVHFGIQSPDLLQKLTIVLSSFFHTNIFHTYSFLAILSLPIAILALSIFAGKVFNPWIGALTALIFGFISIQPVQTYQDGTIPNIYGTGLMIPLFIYILSKTITTRGIKLLLYIPLTVAAFLLLLVTHHLTTLVLIASLTVATLLYSAFLLVKGKNKLLALLPIMGIILFILLIIFVIKPGPVIGIFQQFTTLKSTFPWVVLTGTPSHFPWNATTYGQNVGGIVFQGGLVGLVLLLYSVFTNKLKDPLVYAKLFICGWALVYWLGSLTPGVGEPARLGRDFALPGSILLAFTIWYLYTHLKKFPLILIAITIPLLISVYFPATKRMEMIHSTRPSLFKATDQALLDDTLKESGATLVFSPNFYWEVIAETSGATVSQVYNREQIISLMEKPENRCVIQFYYTVPVAGGIPDSAYKEPLQFSVPVTTTHFVDETKEVWRFCKPSATE